jgi:hypothetical protein
MLGDLQRLGDASTRLRISPRDKPRATSGMAMLSNTLRCG